MLAGYNEKLPLAATEHGLCVVILLNTPDILHLAAVGSIIS
jgi:hypothetical protein